MASCMSVGDGHAQLRVVSYNSSSAAPGNGVVTARAGADIVLEAIGSESVGGIAKPIDVLLLQEQFSMETSAQSFVDLLNDIYDPVTRTMYARSTVDGFAASDFFDGSGGRPGLVYNTQTVSLLGEVALGVASGSQQARQTLRYQLRPVGYDASSDFYVYNSHYKASDSSSDKARRLIEASNIRANADGLGEGSHIIYAGDFNIQSSSESMYVELLSSGNGQAFDPIDTPGSWHNSTNSAIKRTHTQSPATSSQYSGQVLGGVDDRFDFQLTSGEFLDGEGLSIIPGSYHAFGNNGSHGGINSSITTGNGAAPTVLAALAQASDHLPVVADYQLPAVMQAQLASFPTNVPLGSVSTVDVLVENVASVLSPLGADELNYSISVSGDLMGSATGSDPALGGFNMHSVLLDTSVLGARSGLVTVSSASQGVMNPLFQLPVNFIVGEGSGGPTFGVIASDDFDSSFNRTTFSQTPAAGSFGSPADGFQVFQAGVSSSIPFALVDDSYSVFTPDQQGIVDGSSDSPSFKSDAWFGVVDVVNDDNPSDTATAVWTFDITGAVGLEVSIDMAAMGEFDAADTFLWTYSIDEAEALPLFTSSVDEAGSAIYELVSGTFVALDDPLLMENAQGESLQLSNDFQTLTSLLEGSGDTLSLQLIAITNGNASGSFNDESYAFDNIVISGFTGADADFDQDGDVDGSDFLTWQRNTGSSGSLADGDANGDGQVDELDLAAWQSQFGFGGAASLAASVPEPGGLVSLLSSLLLLSLRRAS